MSNNHEKGRVKRPPIVVVMGHIDHGKSTLLDHIRKSNIVAGEAGGITQHVGAYQVEHISKDNNTGTEKKHTVTFLDTPGHEAFCGIRERGAKAADIAILVVSAEDGVKPQTIEAYKEIKSAGIPFVVAINKIDKPNADINRAKQSLGENEIYVEGWGGDIPCVAISALNGTGVSELLDMVILVAELADLKADPNKPSEGVVVESELDPRKGISATLIVKDGVLEVGKFVVTGTAYSPVRFIEDFKGDKIEKATASTPVVITGWNEVPACGDIFVTVGSKKDAERLTGSAASSSAKDPMDTPSPTALGAAGSRPPSRPPRRPSDSFTDDEAAETPKIIYFPIILKADTVGSLDGVKFELGKIEHDKVKIKIVSEGIGGINEKDAKTALGDPENIVIVGFNAEPDKKAAAIIERSPIQVKNFSIIYELSEFVRNALLARVPKEYIEESTGRAKILAIFSKEKDRQVVGGKVETGIISTGNEVRIMRRDAEIGRGKIRELQEKKLRTSEVAEGHEFGVMVEAKVEIAVGDRIEAVRTVEK
ncbi:GTP-binding protein [Patescibacteria group bacterium]|nr:GTP-binding protein [Patescibacteria group bacterium]MDE1946535.1 GTP-binding protein [Patescibacteria group bacterium]MDE2010904.1 GTP-binding protein [Patescibacteria group bacterium]MDE2232788.1 GTP-binding protein [Patescibacteria group bacterium]